MVSDIVLFAVGAGASSLGSAITVGIPALIELKRSREDRNAVVAQQVADRAAEASRSANLTALKALDERAASVIDATHRILDVRARILGMPTPGDIRDLRQVLARGVLVFELDSADYGLCRKWLMAIDAEPISGVDHVAMAGKLLDHISGWAAIHHNQREGLRA